MPSKLGCKELQPRYFFKIMVGNNKYKSKNKIKDICYMKRRFLIITLLLSSFMFFSIMFISCGPTFGMPSPTIAEFEILDSENNIIKDVSISATLDGDRLTDFEYDSQELTDETSIQSYKDNCSFVRGSYIYSTWSFQFSKLIPKTVTEENINDLYSRITILFSKDGYKSKEVTPYATNGHCCYLSIILEKAE